MQLKPNSTTQFTQTLEKEVLPVLRKQEGFQDEVAFIVPGGTEAVEISFWQSKENAEAYSCTGYPEELKALGKIVEGTPQLQTYEVSNSTIQFELVNATERELAARRKEGPAPAISSSIP